VLSAVLLGPRGGWRKSLSQEKPSECGVIVKCVKCRANTNLRQKRKKNPHKKRNDESKKWATLPEMQKKGNISATSPGN